MNEIDATAADWAARFDGASPSRETVDALEAWLALDPRHVGAFARAQALLVAYEDMLVEDDVTGVRKSSTREVVTDRRRLLQGGGIAAGLAALGVGVGGVWLASAETAYATDRGERRVLELGDGAELTLNTLTHVRVRNRGRSCRIRFIDGEILARNRSAPMRVLCDETILTPGNALFGLRRTTNGSILTVVSGAVAVEPKSTADGLLIGQGGRMLISTTGATPLPFLDHAAVERALAWRGGRVAFDGQTLREAVAEFERYGPTPIVIADNRAGGRRISGLFAADDPSGFARAVAVTSGLRAETRDGRIYLSAPDP